ncbi:DUF3558 family protein [Nocardioides dilutus]
MTLRRIAVLLLVVPVFAGCGGGDDGDDGGDDKPEASDTSTSPSADGGDAADACSLVSRDDVAQAVGAEVGEGVSTGADNVITGGSQSTCTWTGTKDATAVATVTVYTEASAADSVRTDDSEPLPEVGDDAFVGPFASVWAYAGGGSFMAQWYALGGSDEDNLPKSTALALLVRDAL